MSGIAGRARSTPAGQGTDARILVVMPAIPLHGMERATLQIMKLLRERGAEVLFVTERRYGDRIRREVEQIGCRWTTVSHERHLRVPRGIGELAGLIAQWAGAVRDFGRAHREFVPTHIHVTNLGFFWSALPLLATTRAHVVFRVPNGPDVALGGWKGAAFRLMWRTAARCSDVVVCNSAYTGERLRAVGIPSEKIRLIRNCVPERRPGGGDGGIPSASEGRHVVYVGQLRPQKGVGVLFRAAVRIVEERPDVSFVFAGDYEWNNPFAASLIAEARDRGLSGRIRFVGFVEDVAGLLRRADLHVCPSISDGESFPNVLLEAKRESVPSVGFPTAGIPEAIEHGKDGFVCADRSESALYEGISWFLDRPSETKRAGEAARASLERFSEEHVAGEWLDVFGRAR